eukprot:TRINITY_DN760_c2_g1_i1.p2 TRINITY_DN760_c2_g1~~TRINITY_DN760_c2_g1_i1.p2  ORF type:complete len:1290 (-),score=479.69 TRINITY_DN760_c2_g1_i1:1065-4934(-)
MVAHALAQHFAQRRLAGTDRAADAYAQRIGSGIAHGGLLVVLKRKGYKQSGTVDATVLHLMLHRQQRQAGCPVAEVFVLQRQRRGGGLLQLRLQGQQDALPRHLAQRHRLHAGQHLVLGPGEQHAQHRRFARHLQGHRGERQGRGQRHFRLGLQDGQQIRVAQLQVGSQLAQRVTHLDGLGAKLGGVARRHEALGPERDRIGIARFKGRHQSRKDGRLEACHHLMQRMADPITCRRFAIDPPILDGRFQPLRIAVGADRQGRAAQLQQMQQGTGLHGSAFFLLVAGTMDLLAQRDRCQRVVVMVVAVMVMATAIGTGFRFEGGLFLAHLCAQAFQHFLEHRILADAQEARATLMTDMRLGMTVAEVEGATQQQVRVGGIDAIGGFGLGDDLDHTTIIATQQVAIAQHSAAHGEHGHILARAQRRAQAALLALVVGQFQFAVDLVGLVYLGIECQHEQDGQKSEQEITLRQRQRHRRLAHQQFAIGSHFIGLGIDFHLRRGAVVDHVALAQVAHVLDCHHRLVEFQLFTDAGIEGCLRDEGHRGLQATAIGAEHHPVMHRLWRRDGGIRVTHLGGGDHAALQDHRGLGAEEGRLPQHDIGELAHLQRTDHVRDAVGDGRVDGVLGDIALDAEVVVAGGIFFQRTALHLHLVRGLPGAQDHLAHATHGLRVGRHHRDRADVMQDVFSGDGLAADARFGKGDVFGDGRVQVMADHQHVQVFVERIDREGTRRIGGGGQHVALAHGRNDVRRMAATGTLGVEGVDGTVLEGGQGVLQEATFIEGIGVDGHLDVHAVGHSQAVVDGRRGGAPVLVQLQADGAGADLFFQRQRQADIALAQEAQVHREGIGRRQHGVDVPGTGRAGGRRRAHGRSGAATDHGGDAAHQRFLDLLRADEVDVAVDTAGGDDHAFARDDLGGAADGHRHAGLDVGIAGLADAGDAARLDADVRLDDAPVVDDERIGDDGVHHVGVGALRLAHAIADHLAAAEFHFLAVDRIVLLDFEEQFGIGQAHAVADGGTEHLGIGRTGNLAHWVCPFLSLPCWAFSLPITSALKPQTRRSPASATSSTVRSWPGSKRTAVPAAMFRRMPQAAVRSNSSAGLVSQKWKWDPTWIGRSPLLATVTVTVGRPVLSSMSPGSTSISPGIMTRSSRNRMVDGDQLAAVGEGGLHLDVGDHLRHALHDVGATQDGGAFGHQLGHGLAVARALHDGGGDQRHRFRIVELQAPCLAAFGHQRGGEDQQLVFLSGCQFHVGSWPAGGLQVLQLCTSLDAVFLMQIRYSRYAEWLPAYPSPQA